MTPEAKWVSEDELPCLPCHICGKPVEKDDWFIIVSKATERVRTGTPYQGVPQRPVHLDCILALASLGGGW